MSRLIGVTPLYDRLSTACQQARPRNFPAGVTSSLKRDALLFDSLAVTDWGFVGGREFIWSLPKKGNVIPNAQERIGNNVHVPEQLWTSFIGADTVIPEVAAEVNWLFEQGLLHHAPHFELQESILDSEVPLLRKFVRENLKREWDLKQDGWAGVSRSILPLNRLVCLKLEATQNYTAVPIYSTGDDADILRDSCSNTALGDVVQVAIQAMPQPDELTTWEEILEFREDPEARAMALSLRRWMRKMTSDLRPIKEIQEELEWLLNEYERYMRLHSMKVNTGVVETVLTTTAEFIEATVKLKFSQAAGLLFVAKHRRIALLEAELQAPGREIAYISKASAEFGRRE